MAKVVNDPVPEAPEKASGAAPAPAPAPIPPESPEPAPSTALEPPAKAPEAQKTPVPGKPGKAPLPATARPYLDSPASFGIWIGGILVRFNKGKTKLTEEQADALEKSNYTAANGAEVVR